MCRCHRLSNVDITIRPSRVMGGGDELEKGRWLFFEVEEAGTALDWDLGKDFR